MADLGIDWPAELSEEWVSEPENDGEASPIPDSFSDTGSTCGTVEIKPVESNKNGNNGSGDASGSEDSSSKLPPQTPEWKRLVMERIGGSPASFSKDLFTPPSLERSGSAPALERLFTPPADASGSPIVKTNSENESPTKSKSKSEQPANRPLRKSGNFAPRPTKLSVLQEINESPARSEIDDGSSVIHPVATSTLRSQMKAPQFKLPSDFGKNETLPMPESSPAERKDGNYLVTPDTVRSKASSNAEGFSEIAIERSKTSDGKTIYTPAPLRQARFLEQQQDYSPIPDNKVFPSSPPWLSKHEPNARPMSSREASHEEDGTQKGGYGGSDNSIMHRFLNSTPQLPPPLPPRDISRLPDTPDTGKPVQQQTPQEGENDNTTPFFTPYPERRVTTPKTPSRTPRTPSPHKRAPGTPRSKPGSPLKLFSEKHDTFTQNILMRRMSQLESTVFEGAEGKKVEENAIADDDEEEVQKANSSSASSELQRSKSEASASLLQNSIPALLPLVRPQQQNSKAPVRRPRSQTTNSTTSSTINDGIRGPKSPMKDRTPKRLRRSLSGSYKPNGQGEVLPSRDRARVRHSESIPEVDTSPALRKSTQQTPRRNASPSPTPVRRPPAPKSPSHTPKGPPPPQERKKATPVSRRTAEPIRSDSDDKIEFKGYGGVGPLADSSFQPNTSTASGSARKGSVTTQDFLAQAEEVMARIRGMKQRSLRVESDEKKIRQSIKHLTDSAVKTGDKSNKRRPQEDDEDSDNSYGLPDFDESTHLSEKAMALAAMAEAHAKGTDSRPCTRRENRSKMGAFDTSAANVFPENRREEEGKYNQTEYSSVMLLPQDGRSAEDEEGYDHSDEEHYGQDVLPASSPVLPQHRNPHRPSSHRIGSQRDRASMSIEAEANPNVVLQLSSFDPRKEHPLRRPARENGPPPPPPRVHRSASDGVQNIHPTEVQHLLQNEIGGMSFDKDNMAWVKRKSQEKQQLLSDDSDDPFAEVSDLVVDEESERRAAELMRKQFRTELEEFVMNSADEDEGNESLRLLKRKAEAWKAQEAAREQGEEEVEADANNQSLISLREQSDLGSEDDYSQYSEDQLPSRAGNPSPRKARRAQVSFMESSPVRPNYSQYPARASKAYWTSDQISERDLMIDQSYVHPRHRRPAQVFSSASRQSATRRSRLGRGVSHAVPQDPNSADPRKMSFTSSFRRLSLSSALTPLPTPLSQRMDLQLSSAAGGPTPVRKHPDVSFHQSSPLPDMSYQFEATQALMNLELSHIAENRGLDLTRMKAVRELFSQAQELLVKHLTDIEPFEPHWDHMSFLRLARKGMTTLHGLHEWCPRIAELDVSENEIGQVSGVPNSVRTLKMPSNHLSSLTAWGHLTNIQYLDISKNRIDSLTGLRHMVHLRELVADDNLLENLDGILHLDGLLSLRVRRNKIKRLKIESAYLTRLSELDLRGNEMERISGLENLPALASLNLEQNELSSLELPEETTMDSVRNLKLSYNNFSIFDVTPFPNLKLLLLDDNRLGECRGLRKAKHIDTLSIKNQALPENANPPAIADMYEIRKLFLSRNPFRSVSVPLDFMNLQYLELANTQLTTLPKDFGHMMSNTRVLNLNYNVLQDIRPLFGMCRLKKLYLVGNRISSMKRTSSVFRYFPHLSSLDIRLNPLTLGFYPPQSTTPHSLPVEPDSYPAEPFALQDADETTDIEFRARLDLETAVLRRRYEIWCVKELKRLKKLDGLNLVGREWKGDAVWKEMVKRGLVIEEQEIRADEVEGDEEEEATVVPLGGEQQQEKAEKDGQDQRRDKGRVPSEQPSINSSNSMTSGNGVQGGEKRSVSANSRATTVTSCTSSPSVLLKETILASETG